jgi:hypothetical protein
MMFARVCCLLSLMLLSGLACAAGPKKSYPETTDPAAACKDPDFAVQGEYLGTGRLAGVEGKLGAQVIALGGGKFKAVVYRGGLPGAGWKRGAEQYEVSGERKGVPVVFSGSAWQATIEAQTLTLQSSDQKTKAALKRIERTSPSLGLAPPQGATVLFRGTLPCGFPDAKLSPDNNLIAPATSQPLPQSYRLHLEFRLSYMPTALGQARSNSGVYLHDCYEIQVLDSFGLYGRNNECGGFYSIREPDVNLCLPPLVWQTYDIDFRGPTYDAQGNKTANARITVRHNGVPIHVNLELPKHTPGRQKEGPAPRPLHFQGHGCHVQYRNVWIEPQG